MLITYWGRGRELRWQDLRSIFLIPMNSSQVGISLEKSLYCMYYCILWEASLGRLLCCCHTPLKEEMFLRQVLFKVKVFRF